MGLCRSNRRHPAIHHYDSQSHLSSWQTPVMLPLPVMTALKLMTHRGNSLSSNARQSHDQLMLFWLDDHYLLNTNNVCFPHIKNVNVVGKSLHQIVWHHCLAKLLQQLVCIASNCTFGMINMHLFKLCKLLCHLSSPLVSWTVPMYGVSNLLHPWAITRLSTNGSRCHFMSVTCTSVQKVHLSCCRWIVTIASLINF